MEADGLVHREVHDVLPLKTEYYLTPFGRELSDKYPQKGGYWADAGGWPLTTNSSGAGGTTFDQ